jgi:ribonuclease P protein component
MLASQHRLRRSADVQRVRQEGRRWHHSRFTLFVLEQPQDESSPSRFAIVAGRRVGKAVERNRIKRKFREIIRLHLSEIKPGHDFLLIAKPNAARASYWELDSGMVQLMARAGVWVGKQDSEV